MTKLYLVPLLLSHFAVGAPLPILGIETFESYRINHPTEWM